jgi:hypothetical protein
MSWDYSKLRGRIKEKFNTLDSFAEALGMSRTSLSQRLNNQLEFSQNEIAKAMVLLDEDEVNMVDFFYTPKVQKNEHI